MRARRVNTLALAIFLIRSLYLFHHISAKRPGVTPKCFLNTKINALVLSYPHSIAASVTEAPDAEVCAGQDEFKISV
jgi:hypothetical protein